MSEWKEIKLGDLIDVKHGFAFKGDYIEKESNDVILVTPGNFKIGGGWKEEKCKYYAGDIPEEYILNGGDLVVTMTDLSKQVDTLGYPALIPEDDTKVYLHNQRIGLVQKRSNEIDLGFLNWLMRDPLYRWHVVSSASGSTVSHTSPSRIKSYKFLLPPLDEQKTIASVLSSLDDKIDLLHRQNQTLEAMAETLFRQWFVEEAAEDWEEVSLYDAINLVGGGTPKTSTDEYWNGDINWLSGGDIASNHKNFVTSTEKSISQVGLQNSSARILPRYSTVISARGTVGKYCLLSEEMAFSQSNYGIKPKFNECYFFTYLLIAHSVERLKSAAYGSVFDTITTKTFKTHAIQIPSEDDILTFEKEISSYFQKMLSNQQQIETLEKLRDSLLPKLINGDIKVDGLDDVD